MPKTYERVVAVGMKLSIDQEKANKKTSELVVFDLMHKLGTPIIAVPNEHQDMVIGIIVGHDTISMAKRPVAIVFDYVRNKEIMLIPKAHAYNESFARTVSDLHPSDRHVLFYGHEKVFSSIDEDTVIGWDKMSARLKTNGFFDALHDK
ncbi:hypothetical protein LMH73_025075 [Vibrio splendidus]